MINVTQAPLCERIEYRNVLPPGETFQVEQGTSFDKLTVAFETYGKLNQNKDNAVLVCHALSGDSHIKSHHEGDIAGWWEHFIGTDGSSGIDINEFFLISSNVLGGCRGSLGPASINPVTGKPFGMEFPIVTINDMVRAQKLLVDSLGIQKLHAVIGGSMGGMQALEWSILYPESVEKVVAVATASQLSTQSLAFNAVGRHAILTDPAFKEGKYYDTDANIVGLSIARMIAHITYLSENSMSEKFGRKLQNGDKFSYKFDPEFQIESYLRHQGKKFVNRFDANSYLYITKAMTYFDLEARGNGDLTRTFKDARSKYLVITYDTDWLYPPYKGKELANALRNNGLFVSYLNLSSIYGHDSFLLDKDYLPQITDSFLKEGRNIKK
jgi:homoserine O-acetyltransferase